MRLSFPSHRNPLFALLTLSLSLGIVGPTPARAINPKHSALQAMPASVGFGNVQVGNSQSITETLKNVGLGNVTVYAATTTGSGFSASGLTTPFVLTPGESYTFTLTFTPVSSGSVSGNILFSSQSGKSSLGVPLSGTGTASGTLTVSPTTLNFGNVTVGATAQRSATITAQGASVTVSAASNTNSEFLLTGLSLPLTLPAGQSASFALAFAPQASGIASDTLSFASNASNSPTETSTGTGIAPPQHSVTLSWIEALPVVGYNIYRAPTSGGPYALVNSSLDPVAAYTDSTVIAGQTYYYVTTAVDRGGSESGYSNQIQTLIPFP